MKVATRAPQRRSPVGRALRVGFAFTGLMLWWAWHRAAMPCDDHPTATPASQAERPSM